MHEAVLRRLRELVRTSRYVLTTHGQEEMEADGLTIFDVEHCIPTGRVFERQRDARQGEWKYLVRGSTIGGGSAGAVAKVGPSGTLVIITVYVGPTNEAEHEM